MSKGQFGLPIHVDVYGSSVNWRSGGRIYITGLALFLKLTGFGFAQARLFTLLGGLVAAWFVYRAGKRLGGTSAGVTGAFLLLFSWRSLYADHMTRPESWVMAAGAGAFYAFLVARESNRPTPWFRLGLLLGVILDVHATTVHYLVGISIGVLVELLSSRNLRSLAAYGAGVACGCLYWGVVHFFPDPGLAIRQYMYNDPAIAQVSSAGYSWFDQLLSSLRLLYTATWGFTRFGFIEGGYLLAAIGYLARRKGSTPKVLLVILAGMVLSFIFLQPGKNARHVAGFVPLTSLILAVSSSLFARNFERLSFARVHSAYRTIALLSPLLLAYLGGDVWLTWQSRPIAYTRYATALRAIVPAGSNVLAEEYWFYEFHDGYFTSDHTLTAQQALAQHPSAPALEQFLAERKVEIVLLDEQLAQDYDGTPLPEPAHEALAEYVVQRCTNLGLVSGYLYGVESGGPRIKITRVYQCNHWQG